jgi:hypothetical protein
MTGVDGCPSNASCLLALSFTSQRTVTETGVTKSVVKLVKTGKSGGEDKGASASAIVDTTARKGKPQPGREDNETEVKVKKNGWSERRGDR